MVLRWRAGLVSVAILALLFPSHVQATDADGAEYAEQINLGISEFDEKNFAEARAHFARAHEIQPNARTFRALGMAEFELKNYAESIRLLQLAIDSPVKALSGTLLSEATTLLSKARRYVAHLTLKIEPSSAALILDGEPARFSADEELMLSVGQHILEFRAPGFIAEKRSLRVIGGEQESLQVSLHKLAAVASVQSNSGKGDATSEARPLRRNPWLWTALGLVVAGAAAGAAVALTREPTTKTEAPYTGTGGAPPLEAPR